MRLRAGVASDRGLVRPANEDSFLVRSGLYAVCDGMGGARAGEVASQMACMGLIGLDPVSSGKKELRTAVVNTNQAIVSRSLAEDHLLGMGTTLTAVMFKKGILILAHVGDSRAYLYRDGDLAQLTDDHSWVGEMVRRGELTAEQAAVHPHRSVITRALGTDREVDPDIKEISVAEGDRILLCSDGLTGMVSEEQITATLALNDLPQATAEMLIKAALAGGGEDNVTVLVVDVVAGEDEHAGVREGDRAGEEILVGPTDRGELSDSSHHRGRRAGAAVRERFSRRTAPVVRPVGPRADGGEETVTRTLPVQAPPAEGVTRGAEYAAADVLSPGAADLPAAIEGPAAIGGPADGYGVPTVASLEPPSGAPQAVDAPQAPPIPFSSQATAPQAHPRRRTRRRWFFLVITIVVVVAIAIGAFAAYNASVYYVGTYDDGSVALYRGLPGSFLGIELSSVVEVAGVDYGLLAGYMQGRVDAHDLVSKEEGRAFLEALDEQQ